MDKYRVHVECIKTATSRQHLGNKSAPNLVLKKSTIYIETHVVWLYAFGRKK